MRALHPSDSSVQGLAEIKVLVTLNKLYKLKLVSAPVIVNKTLFQLDGYSYSARYILSRNKKGISLNAKTRSNIITQKSSE